MQSLRLIDPDGYEAVTDGYRVVVNPLDTEKEIARLKGEIARQHAEEHAYANYQVSEYRVRIDEEAKRVDSISR